MSILKKAEELINGDRAKQYGDADELYSVAAKLFSEVSGIEICCEDVIMMMVCVKLARESHRHKSDNLVDACGYLELLDRIRNKV